MGGPSSRGLAFPKSLLPLTRCARAVRTPPMAPHGAGTLLLLLLLLVEPALSLVHFEGHPAHISRLFALLPLPRPPSRIQARHQPWRDPSGVEWYSQLGQDRWAAALWSLLLNSSSSSSSARAAGVFFEAGAADGATMSNTLALELRHGWRGVLVEAAGAYTDLLAKNRPKAHRVPTTALWRADGEELTFRYAQLWSGLEARLDEDTRRALSAVPLVQETVRTARLSTVLEGAGVRIVDFLSLDIEGAEEDALLGLDVSRHVVNVLCIEDVHVGRGLAVRALLEATGLYFTPGIRLGHDTLYLRRSPEWSWGERTGWPETVASVEEARALHGADGWRRRRKG